MAITWTVNGQPRSKPDGEFVRNVQQAVGSNVDGIWGPDTSDKLIVAMDRNNLGTSAAAVNQESLEQRVGPATLRAAAYALSQNSSAWTEGELARVNITGGSIPFSGSHYVPTGAGGGKGADTSGPGQTSTGKNLPTRPTPRTPVTPPPVGPVVPVQPRSTGWPWYAYAGIIAGATVVIGGGVYMYAKSKNEEESAGQLGSGAEDDDIEARREAIRARLRAMSARG